MLKIVLIYENYNFLKIILYFLYLCEQVLFSAILKKGYFYPKIKKMIIFINSYYTDERND
jgi:hypothetical protein